MLCHDLLVYAIVRPSGDLLVEILYRIIRTPVDLYVMFMQWNQPNGGASAGPMCQPSPWQIGPIMLQWFASPCGVNDASVLYGILRETLLTCGVRTGFPKIPK